MPTIRRIEQVRSGIKGPTESGRLALQLPDEREHSAREEVLADVDELE